MVMVSGDGVVGGDMHELGMEKRKKNEEEKEEDGLNVLVKHQSACDT